MATITNTPIKVFISGETVTPSKLNELSQSTVALTAGSIVATDIASDAVTTAKILDATSTTTGVTNAKLRHSAALSVIGRTSDTAGAPADIASANDGEVFRRSGTAVGFGTVATAGIADDAVTNDKLSLAANAGEIKKALNADNAPPIYACRAWVNFDGQTADNLAGTYTRTGTEVTVTATAHGLIVGNVARLDFTGGTPTAAVDGTYTVTQVDDANTFRVTTAATGTSSGGTVAILRRLIRGAGNVSNVTYLNASGDYVINFATAMPNANYAVSVGGSFFGNYVSLAESGTAQAFYMNTYNSTPTASNSAVIMCSVFA
jgi:hypothetical protein